MYGDLATWRAYATERGNTAPSLATDANATAALVRASDHIKYRYVANLLPGYDDTLEVVIPATFEAAALELATPGLFSTTYTPSQQKVLTGVGEIKWTPVDAKVTGYEASMPTSAKIEAMFSPFIASRQAPFFAMRSIGG